MLYDCHSSNDINRSRFNSFEFKSVTNLLASNCLFTITSFEIYEMIMQLLYLSFVSSTGSLCNSLSNLSLRSILYLFVAIYNYHYRISQRILIFFLHLNMFIFTIIDISLQLFHMLWYMRDLHILISF